MSQRCLFDKIVNAPSVFTDETVFCADYLPDELPGRHSQLQELFGMFRSVIHFPKKAYQEVVLQGPIGSGKTTLIRYFIQSILQFTRKSNTSQFAAVHINCRKMNRPIPLLPSRPFTPDREAHLLCMVSGIRVTRPVREDYTLCSVAEQCLSCPSSVQYVKDTRVPRWPLRRA